MAGSTKGWADLVVGTGWLLIYRWMRMRDHQWRWCLQGGHQSINQIFILVRKVHLITININIKIWMVVTTFHSTVSIKQVFYQYLQATGGKEGSCWGSGSRRLRYSRCRDSLWMWSGAWTRRTPAEVWQVLIRLWRGSSLGKQLNHTQVRRRCW